MILKGALGEDLFEYALIAGSRQLASQSSSASVAALQNEGVEAPA